MKRVLFMIVPVLLFVLAFHPVNTITVTGKVTDDKGIPVSNAFVAVKGTKNATTTSSDGSYSITVASLKETLVFSCVGYKSVEIRLDGKSTINATLSIAEKELSEVVVVGYDMLRKRKEM